MRRTALMILALILCAAAAPAATVTVSSGMSLQAAADAARDGDTIELGPGTWNGRLVISGRRLTIRAVDSESDAPPTLRACGGRAVQIEAGADVILDGLAIEGEVLVQDARLDITWCTFAGSDCQASLRILNSRVDASDLEFISQPVGITVYNETAPGRSVAISNSIFAKCGTAMRIQAGERISLTDVMIVGPDEPGARGIDAIAHDITLRRVAMSFIDGVALSADAARVALHGVTCLDCGGSTTDATVHIKDVQRLDVTDCWFSENEGGTAGAMLIDGASRVRFEDTSFIGNTARGESVDAAGALAIRNGGRRASVVMRGNQFADNHAEGLGAGALCAAGIDLSAREESYQLNAARREAGALRTIGGTAEIHRSRFHNNDTDGSGGALASEGTELSLVSVIMSDNHAGQQGGAMHLSGAAEAPVIRNCTLVSNVARSEDMELTPGAAIFAAGVFPEITNSILFGNTAPNHRDDSQFVVERVDDDAPGEAFVSHCIIQNGWNGEGTGNRNVDPMFRADERGPLQLLPTSPAIDAGDSGLTKDGERDLDGGHRVLGVSVDIGAFEYCRADIDLDNRVTYEDLDEIIEAWESASSIHDLNADGNVDQADLDTLMVEWTTKCE